MIRKAFEPEVHEKYDEAACNVAIKWFGERGYELRNNPHPKKIDLLGDLFNVEVEVKIGWGHEPWPTAWEDVHITQRKGVYKDMEGFFFVLNEPMTRAVVFKLKLLKDAQLRMISNRKIPHGEIFYCVPLGKGVHFVECL